MMIMNNRFFALLFAISFLSSARAVNVIDEVAWIVGDESILLSDVEEYRQRMRYEGSSVEGDPYCYIPEQLALQKLYLDQAKIDSITADEKVVSNQVEMRITYLISQVGSKEKLEEYFNQDIASLREELTEMVTNQQIIQQMQRKIVGDTKVTPAEVKEFFKSLPDDSIPEIPTQIEVQLLTVAPAVSVKAIEDVKAKLRGFKDRVDAKETEFSTLAILYSEDKESAKHGGELGFMGRGQLVSEFADVAFSLRDPSRVSKVVETEFGFHIMQLIEKSGDKVNVRHILMKPKSTLSEKNDAMKRLDSIVAVLDSSVMSFEQAVALYSVDKGSKNSLGLLTNPKTGSSKFQMSELPQDIAKAVYRLNQGEITKPFMMVDSKGNEVYAIAKVKTLLKAHKANVEDDFMAIKAAYQEQKNAELLKAWVLEKQKSIYVRIDPKWRNCDFQYPGWIK
ncbi:MAG: peptidylprolyl isomerase [Paludibacteraceae bacterium]|nr:peptidylprolyl isomerase [Paludibacteraceae bacterium]